MVSLLTLLVHSAPTHKGKARPRRSGLSARRSRLLLERMEDRCVPSISEFGGLTANSEPADIVPRAGIGGSLPGQLLTSFVTRVRNELGATYESMDDMPDGGAASPRKR